MGVLTGHTRRHYFCGLALSVSLFIRISVKFLKNLNSYECLLIEQDIGPITHFFAYEHFAKWLVATRSVHHWAQA